MLYPEDNLLRNRILQKNGNFISFFNEFITRRYSLKSNIISKKINKFQYFDGTKLDFNKLDEFKNPKGQVKLTFADNTIIEGYLSELAPFSFEEMVIKFPSGWIVVGYPNEMGELVEIPDSFISKYHLNKKFDYKPFFLNVNYFSNEIERYTTFIYREIQHYWDLPKDKRTLYSLPFGEMDNKLTFSECVYYGEVNYWGEKKDSLMPNGKGIYEFNDGTKYQGSLINQNFHGAGLLTYSDGTYYHGEFNRGMKDGIGAMNVINNDSMIGHFKNDQFFLGFIFREGKVYHHFNDGKDYYGHDGTDDDGIDISKLRKLKIDL